MQYLAPHPLRLSCCAPTGQGHTILQVTPSGQVSTFATINPSDPKITAECGTQGVGLTMALVVLSKGYVVVGSTPVPVGSSVAGPGCLILLDAQASQGTVCLKWPACPGGVQTCFE